MDTPEWAMRSRAYYAANKEERRARRREYNAANAEKISASARKYYAANKEKRNAYNREYGEVNKEKVNARRRAYRAANKEKTTAKAMAYRAANKERVKGMARKYYAANAEKIAARSRQWAKLNPALAQARNSRRRALQRGATTGDTAPVMALYALARAARGIPCYWCKGTTATGARHIDHVIPLSKGGSHSAGNLVVACSTCNMKKHATLPEAFTGQSELRFA